MNRPARPVWKSYTVKLTLTYRDDRGSADNLMGKEQDVYREVEIRAMSPTHAQNKALYPYDLSGQVVDDAGTRHDLVYAEAYAIYLHD